MASGRQEYSWAQKELVELPNGCSRLSMGKLSIQVLPAEGSAVTILNRLAKHQYRYRQKAGQNFGPEITVRPDCEPGRAAGV
jgi:hypothetical protein